MDKYLLLCFSLLYTHSQVVKTAEPCDTKDLLHVVVTSHGHWANGIIPDGERIRIACDDGYEFDSESYREKDKDSDTVCCLNGQFFKKCDGSKAVKPCVEKSCLFEGFPKNEHTQRQLLGHFAEFLVDGQFVLHGQEVKYSCQNEEFVLVLPDNSVLEEFSTVCQQGSFNKPKEAFPVCREEPCHIVVNTSIQASTCYKLEQNEACKTSDFRISSGLTLSVECKEGYKLKDNGTHFTDDHFENTTCHTGRLSREYSCVPAKGKFDLAKSRGQTGGGPCPAALSAAEETLLRNVDGRPFLEGLYCGIDTDAPCAAPFIDNAVSPSRENVEYQHKEKVNKSLRIRGTKGDVSVCQQLPLCTGNLDKYDGCRFSPPDGTVSLKHGTDRSKSPLIADALVPHGTNVTLNCTRGYHLVNSAGTSIVGDVTITCNLGAWTNLHFCQKEEKNAENPEETETNIGCEIPSNKFLYVNDHEFLNSKDVVPDKTVLTVQCLFIYTDYDNPDEKVEIRCDNGKLEIPTLDCPDDLEGMTDEEITTGKPPETTEPASDKETTTGRQVTEPASGCEIPANDFEYVFNDSRLNSGDSVDDKTILTIRCGYTDVAVEIHCQSGTLAVPDIDCPEGCEIPANNLEYALNGSALYPGFKVDDKSRLLVSCIEYYTYDTDYQDDDTNSSKVSVEIHCDNGTLEIPNIDCPEAFKTEDPPECMTLVHGSVKKYFDVYTVSCDEGYTLDLYRPDFPQCDCREKRLVCRYGGQTPVCEPAPCKVPMEMDSRMSVFERRARSIIGLSAGMTVENKARVFFNCRGSVGEYLEPSNRRFRCELGKWIEDEKDPNWTLGNRGNFPTCRNATCENPCINGGQCERDDKCKCPHLTSGEYCEIFICDRECSENGGKCIGPGQCGQCPDGRYGNNCEHENCVFPGGAASRRQKKKYYKEGEILTSSEFVCPENQLAEPEEGITCLANGTWTESMKCIKVCMVSGGTRPTGQRKNIYRPGEILMPSEFECPEHHLAEPEEGVTCLPDGTWSGSMKCIKSCIAPDGTRSHGQKKLYKPGETLRSSELKCSVFQNVTSEKEITCLANGSWSESLQCDDCFEQRTNVYPYKYGKRTDEQFINTFDTEEECKLACTSSRKENVSCNAVLIYYYKDFVACYAFSLDDDRDFSDNKKRRTIKYFLRVC